MRNYIGFTFLAMTFVFFLLCFTAYSAEPVMLKKVDSFSIVIDQSGSMYMKDKCHPDKTKMEIAKEVAKNLVFSIPDMEYNGKVYLASDDIMLVESSFKKSDLLKAINSIPDEQEIFGRFTNLETSLSNQKNVNLDSRRDAIIFITDGDWNRGKNPASALEQLYKSKNCVVHVISFSDTDNGTETIEDMREENSETIVLDGCECYTDVSLMKDFVDCVFYGIYNPVEIFFEFDKSDIRMSEMYKLKEISSTPLLFDKVTVNGYTCTIGTEKYNKGLSERRASAVSEFIDVDEENGLGESTTYQEIEKNRRVEILLN